jgi:hypothetical protein
MTFIAIRRQMRNLGRDQQGQAMVLGCVSVLVMALVLFSILNVNRSLHERIRLQHTADASAFSMAVAEARAFNFYAYSNRAIASAYVAIATMHAYMSYIAMLTDVDASMAIAMAMISLQEYAECCSCDGFPCEPQHCVHGAEADADAAVYGIDYLDESVANKLQNMESSFAGAVSAAGDHIEAIYDSETALKLALYGLIAVGKIDKLNTANLGSANTNANGTTNTVLVGVNEVSLNSAYDTSDDNKDNRKKIMTAVVNATRPGFTWDRGGAVGALANPLVVLEYFFLEGQVVSDCEVGTPYFLVTGTPNALFESGGRTAMVADSVGSGGTAFGTDAAKDEVGKKIDSFDWATFIVNWNDGVWPLNSLPFAAAFGPGEVKTGSSGVHQVDQGVELGGSPHNSGDHDTKAVGETDGDDFDTSKFMEFNITDDDSKDYNQPKVFASASSQTRYNDYGQKGPWELGGDDDTGISWNLGGADTSYTDSNGHHSDPSVGKVKMTNTGTAHAVSKAMVYYHRIGDWQEPPNFWNPYWHAKLDAMTLSEATIAVGAVDTNLTLLIDALGVADQAAVNIRDNKHN